MTDTVEMLRALGIQLLGLLVLPVALLRLVTLVVKKGYGKAFSVKERPMPPATLQDNRWGEHRYIHLPGVKVHYVEKGDRSKPLMVFLHGFPEFWYSWRYQLEYFSTNYWCVAVDNRGYGDSDKPTGIDKYSLNYLTEDVKNLVTALGRESCILVGHDWGGALGYAAAERYPELVRAYIVWNCCHFKAMKETQKKNPLQAFMSWYMFFFQLPWLPERFMRLDDISIFNGDLNEKGNPDVAEAYKYTYRDYNSFNSPINYYRCAYQSPMPSYLDYAKGEKIRSPVLSLFGTDDTAISKDSINNSAKFCHDFENVFFDGVGHWSPTQAADKINVVMERYLNKRHL